MCDLKKHAFGLEDMQCVPTCASTDSVNQEERECLEQDVQEAMERQLREEREERDRDSGDEWVDHSDIEECYDEHDND